MISKETIAEEEERRAVLIGAVKACKSRPLLEKTFEFYGANDMDAKSSVLIEAMGNPKVGYCRNPTEEDKYETLIRVYLSGTWKRD